MRVTKGLWFVLLSLTLFPALAGMPGSATAQQQEKRIALVVGNGAYAKSPLATAANDAGLIAQTLQAAGFDVIGARDLDGETLRKSFRDFIQKAESSGPGTVAMVYLAGYGMQLAGENYFMPVDSAINRDTDIPIEALRIGDYVRQLASLPLKANIVVLDAARAATLRRGRPADRQRAGAGRAGSAHADRVQRGAGHRRTGGAGALWRLRPIARRNDPHRRTAAAGSVQPRAASRQ